MINYDARPHLLQVNVGVTSCHAAGMQYGSNSLAKGQGRRLLQASYTPVVFTISILMAVAGDLDLQITTDLALKLSIEVIIDHIHEDRGVILAIGKTSHGEKNGRDTLNSRYDQFKECNWVVSLYVTEDHTKIEEVCRNAKNYVRKTRGTPSDHGDVVEKRKKHHVFALVHRNILYEAPVEYCLRENLVKCVSAYIRGNPDSKFYIGITSGPNATTAMKKRRTGDKYKDMHGINRMVAIFKSKRRQTERQQECRDVENELVKHYRTNPKNLNQIAGGGGKDTTQQWSFVYLGMHDETV